MTKAMNGSVVAVNDATVATGAIVFWKLSDSQIDKETLDADWAGHGLDPKDAPRGASPAKALRRAMREQTGRHRLSRRVGRGSFALVDESNAEREDQDPEYGVRARARLERSEGGPVLAISSRDSDTAAGVRAAYERNLDLVCPRDVSWWLSSSFMYDLQAVALRDAGGVYFIPAAHLPRFHQVASILRQLADHRLYEVPAMRTEEAVAAILDALAGETRTALDGLTTELAEGDLGGRALQSRAAQCDAIAAKLGTYEALLGQRLDALRDSLRLVEANVAAAAMAAVSAANEEVAS